MWGKRKAEANQRLIAGVGSCPTFPNNHHCHFLSVLICEDYLGEMLMCECVPDKNLFTRHGERDLGLAVLYMDKDPTKQRVFTNVNNVNFTSSILTMTKGK